MLCSRRHARTNCLEGAPFLCAKQHKVARLYIAMQDAMRMALRQCAQDGAHVTAHLSSRGLCHQRQGDLTSEQDTRALLAGHTTHRLLAIVARGQAVAELAASAQLHDDVHIFIVLQCFIKVDDVKSAP